ncbi:hypothetical protein HMPREF3228_00298, partial [Streptococcus mitis]
PQAVLEYGKVTLTWIEFDFRRVLVQYLKKRTSQSKILLVSDLNNCSSGN